jgi:hypothetical protein
MTHSTVIVKPSTVVDLMATADTIERLGLGRNDYMDVDGHVCILGAMRVVAFGGVSDDQYEGTGPNWDRYVDMSIVLGHYLHAIGNKAFALCGESSSAWSDRSDQDTVVKALRGAASSAIRLGI